MHQCVLLVFTFVLFSLWGTEAAYPAPNDNGIGANIIIPHDWYSFPVFVNAVRQARPWNKADDDTYNEYGVPRNKKTLNARFVAVTGPYPEMEGIWTWRITGANVTISIHPVQSSCCKQAYGYTFNPTTRQTVAYMNCSVEFCDDADFRLEPTITILSGNVTLVEAIRPGYPLDNYPTFTKTVLNMVKGYNTIRYMDWLATNTEKKVHDWSQRTTTKTMQWLNWVLPVPWEVLIEFTNTIGINPWINIPINATDDYMFQLATLLKQTVNPNLIIYVEFSNEPWNFGPPFPGSVTVDKAKAIISTTGAFLNYDNVNIDGYWGYRWYVWRAMNMSNIFRQVFGDEAMMTHIRPVLNSHNGPGGMISSFGMVEKFFGRPKQFFFGMASAPYFGADNDAVSRDVLIQQIRDAGKDASSAMDLGVAYAKQYGLEWLCYEGGLAIEGDARFDPRIKDILVDFMHGLYATGVLVFNYYAVGPSSYANYWASMDNITTPTPKSLALDQIKNENINSFKYITSNSNVPLNTSDNFVISIEDGSTWYPNAHSSTVSNFLEYMPNGAYYELTVTYNSKKSPLAFSVYINDELQGTDTLPAVNAYTNGTMNINIKSIPRINGMRFVSNRSAVALFSQVSYAYLRRTSTPAPTYVPPKLTYADAPTYPPTSDTPAPQPDATSPPGSTPTSPSGSTPTPQSSSTGSQSGTTSPATKSAGMKDAMIAIPVFAILLLFLAA